MILSPFVAVAALVVLLVKMIGLAVPLLLFVGAMIFGALRSLLAAADDILRSGIRAMRTFLRALFRSLEQRVNTGSLRRSIRLLTLWCRNMLREFALTARRILAWILAGIRRAWRDAVRLSFSCSDGVRAFLRHVASALSDTWRIPRSRAGEWARSPARGDVSSMDKFAASDSARMSSRRVVRAAHHKHSERGHRAYRDSGDSSPRWLFWIFPFMRWIYRSPGDRDVLSSGRIGVAHAVHGDRFTKPIKTASTLYVTRLQKNRRTSTQKIPLHLEGGADGSAVLTHLQKIGWQTRARTRRISHT